MKKAELISEIMDRTGLTRKETAGFVDAFVKTIEETLAAGEKVQIVGFGTFEAAERSARMSRNPHTGEQVEVPTCRAPKFRAGKALKDAVR